MNPTSNPAEHTASHPQTLTATPSAPRRAQPRRSPTTYAPDTRAHSLPALLIPEDYRARAVALHARELILRSPQMSAIALGGFGGGFSARASVGFGGGFGNGSGRGREGRSGRPQKGNCAGSANTVSAADGGLRVPALREILENAVDEAICAIDGGQPGNASAAGVGVVKPRRFRAKTVQPAPASWSYPSVNTCPSTGRPRCATSPRTLRPGASTCSLTRGNAPESSPTST